MLGHSVLSLDLFGGGQRSMVCVRACVRARVRACVCMRVLLRTYYTRGVAQRNCFIQAGCAGMNA